MSFGRGPLPQDYVVTPSITFFLSCHVFYGQVVYILFLSCVEATNVTALAPSPPMHSASQCRWAFETVVVGLIMDGQS